jgi:hypothetical protein
MLFCQTTTINRISIQKLKWLIDKINYKNLDTFGEVSTGSYFQSLDIRTEKELGWQWRVMIYRRLSHISIFMFIMALKGMPPNLLVVPKMFSKN